MVVYLSAYYAEVHLLGKFVRIVRAWHDVPFVLESIAWCHLSDIEYS